MPATAEIRRHWDRVASLNCILTGRFAEIAHCHSGSMLLLPPEFHPGVAQKQNDWLVLPLAPEIHRIGPDSLDGGSAKDWEAHWGYTQLELLQELSGMLGYSVYEKAGISPGLVSGLIANLQPRLA